MRIVNSFLAVVTILALGFSAGTMAGGLTREQKDAAKAQCEAQKDDKEAYKACKKQIKESMKGGGESEEAEASE